MISLSTTEPGVEVIDAQIHIWEEDRPGRPWQADFARTRGMFLNAGPAETAQRAIAAMDAIGVDVAVLTSFLLYPDAAYEMASIARYPGRFVLSLQVDLMEPNPGETLRRHMDQTRLVAIRISFLDRNGRADYELMRSPQFEAWLRACAAKKLPIMIALAGHVQLIAPVASTHPDNVFVIDHLGLPQPPTRALPQNAFEGIDDVLRLSDHANVGIKLTGAPTLSREPFPFRDITEPVARLVRAFGKERVMWGSDFSRTRALHDYRSALHYLTEHPAFTTEERKWLLGRAFRTFLGMTH